MAPALDALAADPMAECIAENERSLDLRKAGKLLDARRELAACAGIACPEAIQQACRGRIGEVNAAIPSIVFDVKGATGQDLADVQLFIDGVSVGPVGVVSRSIDPGRHVFRFESSGRPGAETVQAVERVVVLVEGEKEHRETVVLGEGDAVDVAPASVPAETPSGPASGLRSSGDDARRTNDDDAQARAANSTSSNGVKTAAWVTGGIGLGALATGGALALAADVSYHGASGCSGTQCTQEGFDTRNSARSLGVVATGVMVAGGAAVAVGLVLWLVAPSPRDAAGNGAQRQPLPGPRWHAGLTLGGAVAGGTF